MKVRIEGTQEEINKFIEYQKFLEEKLCFKIKSVSKFYPNREIVFGIKKEIQGRVYIELE